MTSQIRSNGSCYSKSFGNIGMIRNDSALASKISASQVIVEFARSWVQTEVRVQAPTARRHTSLGGNPRVKIAEEFKG
jgi:hypothetical protein